MRLKIKVRSVEAPFQHTLLCIWLFDFGKCTHLCQLHILGTLVDLQVSLLPFVVGPSPSSSHL